MKKNKNGSFYETRWHEFGEVKKFCPNFVTKSIKVCSCSQVILVYLHPFRRNSLFCSQKALKITLNQYF